jgi:hypothetical protein
MAMFQILVPSLAVFVLLFPFAVKDNAIFNPIRFEQPYAKLQQLLQPQQDSSSKPLLYLSLQLSSESNKAGDKITNQYIVILKDNSSKNPSQAAEEAKSKGAQVLHVYDHVLKGFTIKVPNEKVFDAIIKNNSNIDYVEPEMTAQAHD